MEVISTEEYLKVHYGDRKDYFRLDKSRLKPMKFSIGDVIHTIDYHYLEDGEGNDIDQEIMFVNPKVITGKYVIAGFVDGETDDYDCITILDEFGRGGSTAYVGKNVIFEFNVLNDIGRGINKHGVEIFINKTVSDAIK